jgi:hypothetical protein
LKIIQEATSRKRSEDIFTGMPRRIRPNFSRRRHTKLYVGIDLHPNNNYPAIIDELAKELFQK